MAEGRNGEESKAEGKEEDCELPTPWQGPAQEWVSHIWEPLYHVLSLPPDSPPCRSLQDLRNSLPLLRMPGVGARCEAGLQTLAWAGCPGRAAGPGLAGRGEVAWPPDHTSSSINQRCPHSHSRPAWSRLRGSPGLVFPPNSGARPRGPWGGSGVHSALFLSEVERLDSRP